MVMQPGSESSLVLNTKRVILLALLIIIMIKETFFLIC